MSYYSAQSRNGAYKPHAVTFATFAEGNQIQGKLSDFKTDETRHLWSDVDSPPYLRRKHRSKAEIAADAIRKEKNKRGRSEKTAESLKKSIDKSWQEYRNEVEQVKLEGWYPMGEVAKITGKPLITLRRWFYDCKITQTKRSEIKCSIKFVRLDEIQEIIKEMGKQ